MLIDVLSSFRICVGVAVHESTPRAPNRTDIQENWAVQLFGPFESLCAPGIPIHRLSGSTSKIDRTLSPEMVGCSCLYGIHRSKRRRDQHSECPDALLH